MLPGFAQRLAVASKTWVSHRLLQRPSLKKCWRGPIENIVFLFLSHVVMVAYIRGSAVRLGPNQLPDLYERVRILSARVGIEKEPEAYLMQAGGALNAFATKFMRSDMIVIYSDLLEACIWRKECGQPARRNSTKRGPGFGPGKASPWILSTVFAMGTLATQKPTKSGAPVPAQDPSVRVES